MICAIYRSPRKEGMYLYLAKRDEFEAVPESLRQAFGKPQFVMLFNLAGEKSLQHAPNHEVQKAIETQGFYLQMPPPVENLHKAFVAEREIGTNKR